MTRTSWPPFLGLVFLGVLLLGAGAAGAAAVTCGSSARRAVALTFDDGPSSRFTPQILELLQEYQARATFFVLGCKVEKYPEVIKAALAAGHELGNHTYSHPHLPETGRLARQRELERTELDLELLGCRTAGKIMRPPYSEYDRRLLQYLDHTDQELILWSVDSGDWRGLPAAAIVKNVLNQVKNGAIIIFHDSDEYEAADRHPTVEALKIILPALQRAGYRMVTVSELLE